jgi:NADH dehydrogenase
MKTIPQALNIRSFILENFEQAVLTTDVVDQNSLINFVLVGGGPTGGISRCFSRDEKAILQKDYPDLDISKCKSTLFKVVIVS